VEIAAHTTLFAVASEEFTVKLSGEYLQPVAKIGRTSKHAKDIQLAKNLWEWTMLEMGRLGRIPSYE
jgi:hypothetical protein